MNTERNKKIVTQFVAEVWNTKKRALAEQLLSPSYTVHFAGFPTATYEQYFANFDGQLAAFPDIHVTVEQALAEGDLVALRYVWKGTHSAIAYGVPATGNQVSTQGSSIYRVENGKIIEGWVVEDVLGLMQQLGAIQTR